MKSSTEVSDGISAVSYMDVGRLTLTIVRGKLGVLRMANPQDDVDREVMSIVRGVRSIAYVDAVVRNFKAFCDNCSKYELVCRANGDYLYNFIQDIGNGKVPSRPAARQKSQTLLSHAQMLIKELDNFNVYLAQTLPGLVITANQENEQIQQSISDISPRLSEQERDKIKSITDLQIKKSENLFENISQFVASPEFKRKPQVKLQMHQIFVGTKRLSLNEGTSQQGGSFESKIGGVSASVVVSAAALGATLGTSFASWNGIGTELQKLALELNALKPAVNLLTSCKGIMRDVHTALVKLNENYAYYIKYCRAINESRVNYSKEMYDIVGSTDWLKVGKYSEIKKRIEEDGRATNAIDAQESLLFATMAEEYINVNSK